MLRLSRYLHPLVLTVLPVGWLLLNRAWIFTAPGIDAWIYYGYFFNYPQYIRFFPTAYFGTRLSWIVPAYALYHVLPPIPANYVLHLAVFYVAVFALYITLRLTTTPRGALLGTILMGSYPPFLGAVGWNYLDGIGIAYLLLTICLLTCAVKRSRWQGWLLGAGIAFAAAASTNIFLLSFAPFLGVFYLLANQRFQQRSVILSLMWSVLGFVMLMGLLGLINIWAGGEFLFFESSVKFASSGSSEAGNAASQTPIGELRFAHHLVLTFITAGISLLIMRQAKPYWSDQPFTLLFAGLLVALLPFFVVLEIGVGDFLHLHYYANYLLPVVFLVLGSWLSSSIDQLSARHFSGLIILMLLIFSLPLWWGTWRNLALEATGGNFPILIGLIGLAASLLPFAWKRQPYALLPFFIALTLVGYRAIAKPTYGANAVSDLGYIHQDFMQAVYDAIQATDTAFEDSHPTYFWFDNEPNTPFYAIASAHVNPNSFIGNPFPGIFPFAEVKPEMQVAILTHQENVTQTAQQTLNSRLLQAEWLGEKTLSYQDQPFTLHFLRVAACEADLSRLPTSPVDGVIFYPASDFADQLALFPAEHDCLIDPSEQVTHLEVVAAFERALDENHLGLNTSQQALLNEWRSSKDPRYLTELNIEYLLVSSTWTGWLSEAELAILSDPSAYQVVKQWSFRRLDRHYTLYQVVKR